LSGGVLIVIGDSGFRKRLKFGEKMSNMGGRGRAYLGKDRGRRRGLHFGRGAWFSSGKVPFS